MRKGNFTLKVREPDDRLVAKSLSGCDSEWAATRSVAQKMGCTPEPLRKWIGGSQVDGSTRSGQLYVSSERCHRGSAQLNRPPAVRRGFTRL